MVNNDNLCPCELAQDEALDIELGNLLWGNSRGNYRLPRHPSQEIFEKFFDKIGVNGYGYVEENAKVKDVYERSDSACTVDNDIFTIRPYYWGDDEEIMKLPNFVYKPENITIDWYKYPMRDAFSNVPLDEDKLNEIVNSCLEFIG